MHGYPYCSYHRHGNWLNCFWSQIGESVVKAKLPNLWTNQVWLLKSFLHVYFAWAIVHNVFALLITLHAWTPTSENQDTGYSMELWFMFTIENYVVWILLAQRKLSLCFEINLILHKQCECKWCKYLPRCNVHPSLQELPMSESDFHYDWHHTLFQGEMLMMVSAGRYSVSVNSHDSSKP